MNPEPASARTDPTLALLSKLGVEDHRLAQVAQLMEAIQSNQSSDAEIERLQAELARLRELNRILVAHSDFLAAAVGACPECWGEDGTCRVCAGDGGPGAFVPDRISYDEFVRPLLTRMKERLARRRRRQPADPSGPPANLSSPGGTTDAPA
jgi:hypothetical protein